MKTSTPVRRMFCLLFILALHFTLGGCVSYHEKLPHGEETDNWGFRLPLGKNK